MPILIPYNQLSPEQQDIVRRVSRGDKNLYVEGPAGSGKTLISLYALKNFVESESGKILFLMYNYSLYGYLKTALTELDIINGLTIATKDKFFWDLAKFDNYYPPSELSFEAIRVLEKSPLWKPGLQGGKPVAVAYTLPVTFTIK